MITASTVRIPSAEGTRTITLAEPAALQTAFAPTSSRIAFAAGHVVPDARTASAGAATRIDWEQTLRVRHRLWELGLGVAESMDTAQRGMGLGAVAALELGKRTLTEAAAVGGRVVVGITTDQLPPGPAPLTAIAQAYLEQLDVIESMGGSVVLMASRNLAHSAKHAQEYVTVYDTVLQAATRPVILHWLGAMFDPELEGYWGSADLDIAVGTVLELIGRHAESVAGIKVSLLDAEREIALRRRLPDGVRLFTGDDFNYAELIAGDSQGHSDALLGAFAAIPRFASAALARLDAGDEAGFRSILDPTVPLSRRIFKAPTQYYKAGVAWLSFLSGAQEQFRMLRGFESGRSVLHLSDVFAEAISIGLFEDPQAAADRASRYFTGLGF
ncbi:dihydrodipicolinate synthase family protein [Streptomyces sp. RB6PN25]|uniref:Dihydrodipicolinate synthase family protein n=1 Tax=Streptomyces humicola TaxID=2953240 RepID=A0ABT1PT69_9ACTN|nr:DUF993 family protein [Streptomyces humicola]MCQ4080871.1 dihydrodipicolinate synthase family protein [Streptomyces humicola]